jgi:hypothetical protein
MAATSMMTQRRSMLQTQDCGPMQGPTKPVLSGRRSLARLMPMPLVLTSLAIPLPAQREVAGLAPSQDSAAADAVAHSASPTAVY